MLDIGWSEMAVIAFLALIVIGPKDLPKVMRTIGQWTRKARGVAREFQSGLDEMMRESELDEARKTVERTSNFDVGTEVEREVDPSGSLRQEAGDLDRSARDLEPSDSNREADKATVVTQDSPTAPGHSVDAGKPKSSGTKASGSASSGSKKTSGARTSSGSKKAAGSKTTSSAKTASGLKSPPRSRASSGSKSSSGAKATSGKGAAGKSGGSQPSGGKVASGTGGKAPRRKSAGSKTAGPKSSG